MGFQTGIGCGSEGIKEDNIVGVPVADTGGRIILTQSVLQSLPVYWFTLFVIPLGTIDCFLWGGWMGSYKIHLVCWRRLSRPSHLGSWGIKRLRDFSIDPFVPKVFGEFYLTQACGRALFRKRILKGLIPLSGFSHLFLLLETTQRFGAVY